MGVGTALSLASSAVQLGTGVAGAVKSSKDADAAIAANNKPQPPPQTDQPPVDPNSPAAVDAARMT